MNDNILYSPETSGLLIAMTALQHADGVPADVALQRAHEAWRDHIRARGNDTWEFADLTALVVRLTT